MSWVLYQTNHIAHVTQHFCTCGQIAIGKLSCWDSHRDSNQTDYREILDPKQINLRFDEQLEQIKIKKYLVLVA